MPMGPGVYDDLCTHVLETADAQGAIVIVFGGEHGSGFSVQADLETQLALPTILEDVARQIRASLKGVQLQEGS